MRAPDTRAAVEDRRTRAEDAQVVECHRVTGEDCFIKVYLDALENLDRILDRFLRYGQTTISIVQSTPVPLRAPPLPGNGGQQPIDALQEVATFWHHRPVNRAACAPTE
jgi:DNA-binding Lrp family transcriptional regulator